MAHDIRGRLVASSRMAALGSLIFNMLGCSRLILTVVTVPITIIGGAIIPINGLNGLLVQARTSQYRIKPRPIPLGSSNVHHFRGLACES